KSNFRARSSGNNRFDAKIQAHFAVHQSARCHQRPGAKGLKEGMECWSKGVLGESAYWEEWGFDATNRERNEICLFPVLHHPNTPTSFGFVPSVHLLITPCPFSKSKVFPRLIAKWVAKRRWRLPISLARWKQESLFPSLGPLVAARPLCSCPSPD